MKTLECGAKELAKLPVVKMQDVLIARMIAREEASRLGFTPQALTQIATTVSELARNVVQHAGAAGSVRIFEARNTDTGRAGILILVQDRGVGFPNPDGMLAGTSPGAGLPGCRKLMDDLSITSVVNAGTSVRAVKWLARE